MREGGNDWLRVVVHNYSIQFRLTKMIAIMIKDSIKGFEWSNIVASRT